MERGRYQKRKGTILQAYVMSARHMLCGKHITSSKEATSYWLQTAFPCVNDYSELSFNHHRHLCLCHKGGGLLNIKKLKFHYCLNGKVLFTGVLQGLQPLNQDTSQGKAEVFNGLMIREKA